MYLEHRIKNYISFYFLRIRNCFTAPLLPFIGYNQYCLSDAKEKIMEQKKLSMCIFILLFIFYAFLKRKNALKNNKKRNTSSIITLDYSTFYHIYIKSLKVFQSQLEFLKNSKKSCSRRNFNYSTVVVFCFLKISFYREFFIYHRNTSYKLIASPLY